jgi:hypothetical protein
MDFLKNRAPKIVFKAVGIVAVMIPSLAFALTMTISGSPTDSHFIDYTGIDSASDQYWFVFPPGVTVPSDGTAPAGGDGWCAGWVRDSTTYMTNPFIGSDSSADINTSTINPHSACPWSLGGVWTMKNMNGSGNYSGEASVERIVETPSPSPSPSPSPEATTTATTTPGFYNGLNYQEELFILCVIIFFISVRGWRYIFAPFNLKSE